MSYIDCQFNPHEREVLVWERTKSGRRLVRYSAPLYFYVPDKGGEFVSLYGDRLKRLEFDTYKEMRFERDLYQSSRVQTFESDIPPDIKVLMERYVDDPVIDLHCTLFDIEAAVDLSQDSPFPSFHNPYAFINAVTLFHQWLNEYVILAVPPPGWVERPDSWSFLKPNMRLVLCKSERELLERLLVEIDDTDVLSGWNSDFFDLPYLFKRTELTLGRQHLARWTFNHAREPEIKEVERFGSREITIQMTGRQHLDYLGLFKKYNLAGRASYALQAIAEEELNESKVQYDGTLEELYEENFEELIRYNVHDVTLLVGLDQKFKYLQLANQMAHVNTVRLPSVLGTVAYVETGLTNFAHKAGLIVNDKPPVKETEKIEGAIVLTPRVGLHPWVGSVDINSLYPNVIRSLNISPEKIIGQFQNSESDWRGISQGDAEEHTLLLEDGSFMTHLGHEWKNEILPARGWAISAFGTVFDQRSGVGLIPEVLGIWFKERKEYQAEKKRLEKVVREIEESAIKLDASLDPAVTNELLDMVGRGELVQEESRLLLKDDYARLQEARQNASLYDILQGVKKVQLNSTYGALLSPFFRFNRRELGGSTTATGRQITTHMNETIGEFLTGEPTKLIKETHVDDDGAVTNTYRSTNPALIAADTDSVAADSVVETSLGRLTIEALWNLADRHVLDGGKEYALFNDQVLSTCVDGCGRVVSKPIQLIYRHLVSKPRWRVEVASGEVVDVTGDHSIMVKRNGELVAVKAAEINALTDTCLCLPGTDHGQGAAREVKITRVERLADFSDEHVYDIVMEDVSAPYFFANGILVHNSCYFKMEGITSLEDAVELADAVAEHVNSTFQAFMRRAFNCQDGFDNLIRAGREVVAERGIFLARKKYVLKVLDQEGKRVNKLKMMGVEMKKSDTPKPIQRFLETIIRMILDGETLDTIARFIIDERARLFSTPEILLSLGVTKAVNKFDRYWNDFASVELATGRRVNLPGHVRAACNWNVCLQRFGDKQNQPIRSGDKVKVLYVKPNGFKMSAMAFPVDLTGFPPWFAENFEVDVSQMEVKLIDQKLAGIYKALGAEVPTRQGMHLSSLLEFD